MAVAKDAHSESHTGTTGSASEASFTWSHNPVGTPRGVLVFVFQANNTGDDATSVTYAGANLTKVTGGMAVDAAGEPGRCTAWFLGSSVPTNDPATIVVNRTNNANVMYAICITVTAATDTEVYTAGIVLVEGDGTIAAQSVNDGSPGTNSMRAAGGFFGGPNVPSPDASTGGDASSFIDFGAFTCCAGWEITPGQGSRTIGFSSGATSDDRAFVHLAIREPPATTFTANAAAAGVASLTMAAVRALTIGAAAGVASASITLGAIRALSVEPVQGTSTASAAVVRQALAFTAEASGLGTAASSFGALRAWTSDAAGISTAAVTLTAVTGAVPAPAVGIGTAAAGPVRAPWPYRGKQRFGQPPVPEAPAEPEPTPEPTEAIPSEPIAVPQPVVPPSPVIAPPPAPSVRGRDAAERYEAAQAVLAAERVIAESAVAARQRELAIRADDEEAIVALLLALAAGGL